MLEAVHMGGRSTRKQEAEFPLKLGIGIGVQVRRVRANGISLPARLRLTRLDWTKINIILLLSITSPVLPVHFCCCIHFQERNQTAEPRTERRSLAYFPARLGEGDGP
jgi:hypothetical protein